MGVFIAELIKIRRSAAWILAALVPSVTAVASAMGAWTSGGFEDGWNTLWIRSIGLYGMLMLGVGLSVLASLVWRAEHTGNNWNAMAAQPVAAWRLASAKVLALALLATFMQAVLLLTVLFLERWCSTCPLGSLLATTPSVSSWSWPACPSARRSPLCQRGPARSSFPS